MKNIGSPSGATWQGKFDQSVGHPFAAQRTQSRIRAFHVILVETRQADKRKCHPLPGAVDDFGNRDGKIHLSCVYKSHESRPGQPPASHARKEPRIGLCSQRPDRIELEADCRVEKQNRPVVVLNSDRIRESLHASAEAYLRRTLSFPLIAWEHSPHADPVVRFHDPATNRKTCPPEVRAGLIELLYSETVVVGLA